MVARYDVRMQSRARNLENFRITQPLFLGSSNINNGSTYSTEPVRKPTRLEALPNTESRKIAGGRKRSSGPILNTMGTF